MTGQPREFRSSRVIENLESILVVEADAGEGLAVASGAGFEVAAEFVKGAVPDAAVVAVGLV
jgi:hypothetical protein